jgi:phenylacetate-coenzyme A ligase PaaK-like adenylate-forming protein
VRLVNLEGAYSKLPARLQTLACTVEGARIQRSRYGGDFQDLLRQAQSRTFAPWEEVKALRDDRVRRFVEHCARTVPYYRRQFRELGLDPRETKSLDDLEHVPILKREVVQERPAEFASEAVPECDRIRVHTSGSAGSALHLDTTLSAVREQWATWWRYWGWHGIEQGMWCAAFGGRAVVPLTQKRPPFWRYNYVGRQILFSSYHLGRAELDAYLGELRRARPPWLHGFPSVLALVAERALETGFEFGYPIRWVTIGGENLLAQQATLMQRAFGVRPKQHYGLTEATSNISECPNGTLHVDEDFASTEFVPSPDQSGALIVGTNFTNLATPLLRYDLEDVATVERSPCTCGRPGRAIASVDGRLYDYVVLTNGERMIGLDYIFQEMLNVREAQIYQPARGELVFRVVPRAGYGEADETLLLSEAKRRLGDETKLRVEYINAVERSRTGKLRFIVSDVSKGKLLSTTQAAATGRESHAD